MRNPFFSLLFGIAIAAGTAGCEGPQPLIREGDADSVQIAYGGDVERAYPLARRHCARFERVPRFVSAGIDIAQFDCVHP